MKYQNKEDILGPRKIKLIDILLNTAGAFISGIIGSILLLIIIFALSGILDIGGAFKQTGFTGSSGVSMVFPFSLSIITFFVSIIVMFLTYLFLTKTDPEKFSDTMIHNGQIVLFGILTYIFLTPIYIYTGIRDVDNILYVFLIHIFIISFGLSLLLELLNNYRYILVGFYANFIGLFISGIIILSIFFSFSDGYAKLWAMLIILPMINSLIIFFKGIFEFLYYEYYRLTGMDQLGDIFRQIEEEENEMLREAIDENNHY